MRQSDGRMVYQNRWTANANRGLITQNERIENRLGCRLLQGAEGRIHGLYQEVHVITAIRN